VPVALVEELLPHVTPFVATLSRLGGLFIFAPLLAGAALPHRIKVFILLVMALTIYPALGETLQTPAQLDMVSLVPVVVTESLVGAVMGLMMLMPIAAVQLAGLMMGQQMGLALADVIDPTIEGQTELLGQALSFLAFGAYLAAGGLEAAFGGVLYSFHAAPVGGVLLGQAPLDLLVAMLASGYELALRIAAPVLCIIFVETVAMGFVMKTVPQINVLSVGFPVKILAGVSVLTASLVFINEAIEPDIERAIEIAVHWAASLGRAQ
jgi:flagellar biosynthesis protein FliR